MFDRLLPPHFDNNYRGPRLALWIFVFLVLLTSVMSINSIVIGHTVAEKADGIPLDTYTPAGARAVVSLFGIWGLSQLMLRLLCVLALIRYRTMIPLLYATLLLEALSRRLFFLFEPITKSGPTVGFPVNLVLLALMAFGLVLSLRLGPVAAK